MSQGQTGDLHYAGFWIRFVAEIIDSIVLMIASMILPLMFYGVVFWMGSGSAFTDIVLGQEFQLVSVVAYTIVSYFYYVWGQYKYGTTFGKRVLGIYVVDARTLEFMTIGQAHLRALGYIISSAIFSVGYLMAAFHPQKRALHDLMANTYSIIDREGRYRGRT